MRKIFHLEIKSESSHKYYGSLAALAMDNKNINVSVHTLYKFDFHNYYYENNICIIRMGYLMTKKKYED